MEGDTGINDLFQSVYVEFRGVRACASRRQIHHGYNNLVVQSMVSYALPGVLQIADIIECVKVSDGGYAMFFKHFGVQINDIPGGLT